MMIDIASITSRGQFTIPSRLCKFLNLKAGSKMFIVTDGEHLLLKKLAPPDQAVLSRAFAAAGGRMDVAVRRDDAAALAAMKKQGMTITSLDPAEAKRWRELGLKVTAELEASRSISPEMLAAVRRALAAPKAD